MPEQLSLFAQVRPVSQAQPYTVSQLTGYIRGLIEEDPVMADVWVEGEVSNFGQASSGHAYFTLRDAGAEIGCVMWRNVLRQHTFLPTDGDQVLAHGRVGVYELRGRYQLYVDRLQPAGTGSLYLAFERLKARLESEGLFASERKRPLPPMPRCIGVVTSPTAAALQDILNVLRRRYPLAEVLLAPTQVQGEEAPEQIVAALEALNRRDDVDLIIVARGGGSLEDLWAFNDERVARTIAAARHPVICGVGHETDYSLADFAADVRAPTPSAAAELAVPDRGELRTYVAQLGAALTATVAQMVARHRQTLNIYARTLEHLSPLSRLAQSRQRVDELSSRSETLLRHRLALHRERVRGLAGRLKAVSPIGTMERGYAIVYRRDTGDVVRSVEQVAAGDLLRVQVGDGEFEAEVTHG
ncbi:MAG TPA: exodeoxyribonuclease VII large subunit [Chloroflexi bacterium]|nr:exodeoxyribonuclease VII large subunit [Chloroflexota bacterium]